MVSRLFHPDLLHLPTFPLLAPLFDNEDSQIEVDSAEVDNNQHFSATQVMNLLAT